MVKSCQALPIVVAADYLSPLPAKWQLGISDFVFGDKVEANISVYSQFELWNVAFSQNFYLSVYNGR